MKNQEIIEELITKDGVLIVAEDPRFPISGSGGPKRPARWSSSSSRPAANAPMERITDFGTKASDLITQLSLEQSQSNEVEAILRAHQNESLATARPKQLVFYRKTDGVIALTTKERKSIRAHLAKELTTTIQELNFSNMNLDAMNLHITTSTLPRNVKDGLRDALDPDKEDIDTPDRIRKIKGLPTDAKDALKTKFNELKQQYDHLVSNAIQTLATEETKDWSALQANIEKDSIIPAKIKKQLKAWVNSAKTKGAVPLPRISLPEATERSIQQYLVHKIVMPPISQAAINGEIPAQSKHRFSKVSGGT
jgi:hypothetical protein